MTQPRPLPLQTLRLFPQTSRTLISKSIWEYDSGRAWVYARLFFLVGLVFGTLEAMLMP